MPPRKKTAEAPAEVPRQAGPEPYTPDQLPPIDVDPMAAAQRVADLEAAAGLRGTEVDATPNEHYTVAGVIAGMPTPETTAGP